MPAGFRETQDPTRPHKNKGTRTHDMNENQAARSRPGTSPETNQETNPEIPQEEPRPIHQWPDSLTLMELVGELATEEAAAEIEREDPDFRFSASMHDSMCSHSPGCGNSLRLAPGIDAAVSEAVRAYQPSDMLYEVLGQEMRALAETARDLLPGEQWDRLRQAAKEELQRKIQDTAAGA